MADAGPTAAPALPVRPGLVWRAFGNRTGMGFLGAGFLVLVAKPKPGWFEAGLAVALCGVAWRFWASGCLQKNQDVARTGPYRLVRHPLYLGSAILWGGLLAMGGNRDFVPPAAMAFVLYHALAIRREERYLLGKFGEAYAQYRREVPALVPWTTPHRLPGALLGGGFSWALAWKHREWHVGLAVLLFGAGLHAFMSAGLPRDWRLWTAAALGVALLLRLTLFALLDRDIQNPAVRALVALVSRKKRRERARRAAGAPAQAPPSR